MFETDARDLEGMLAKHGRINREQAAAALAKLTDKQREAALADFRSLHKPLQECAAKILEAAKAATTEPPANEATPA